MKEEPTTEQKRECLRRLLADGPQAARAYLKECAPPLVLIYACTDPKDLERYEREGRRLVLLMQYGEDEAATTRPPG